MTNSIRPLDSSTQPHGQPHHPPPSSALRLHPARFSNRLHGQPHAWQRGSPPALVDSARTGLSSPHNTKLQTRLAPTPHALTSSTRAQTASMAPHKSTFPAIWSQVPLTRALAFWACPLLHHRRVLPLPSALLSHDQTHDPRRTTCWRATFAEMDTTERLTIFQTN